MVVAAAAAGPPPRSGFGDSRGGSTGEHAGCCLHSSCRLGSEPIASAARVRSPCHLPTRCPASVAAVVASLAAFVVLTQWLRCRRGRCSPRHVSHDPRRNRADDRSVAESERWKRRRARTALAPATSRGRPRRPHTDTVRARMCRSRRPLRRRGARGGSRVPWLTTRRRRCGDPDRRRCERAPRLRPRRRRAR